MRKVFLYLCFLSFTSILNLSIGAGNIEQVGVYTIRSLLVDVFELLAVSNPRKWLSRVDAIKVYEPAFPYDRVLNFQITERNMQKILILMLGVYAIKRMYTSYQIKKWEERFANRVAEETSRRVNKEMLQRK